MRGRNAVNGHFYLPCVGEIKCKCRFLCNFAKIRLAVDKICIVDKYGRSACQLHITANNYIYDVQK